MRKFLNNFRATEIKNAIASDNFKKKVSYIKGSVISILAGLIVSSFLLCYKSVNPFEYFTEVFSEAFDDIQFGTTMQWFALYSVVGLSIAFSFKCGLFNIGAAGQIIAGSGTVILIFGKYFDTNNISTQGIIGIFLISTIMGTALGSIAGVLKSKFKIHEVVSTIMLNWIVWYTVEYFIYKDNSLWGAQSTIPIETNLLTIGDNIWIIPVIIALVCVFGVWFVFRYTTFGLKLKSVGLSPEASRNAGININHKIIQALAISGFLSGVGSFLDILTIHNSIPFTNVTLPTLGFDSISIALVAFNNPIGMIFVSFLWAIIQGSGGDVANLYQLSVYISNVIFGIIIYTAAISEIFVRMNAISQIKYWLFLCTSKVVKIKSKTAKEEYLLRKKQAYENIDSKIDEVNKKMLDQSITPEELNILKKELKSLKVDKSDILRHERKRYKNEISQIRSDEYKKQNTIGKYRIIYNYDYNLKEIRHDSNKKVNILKINFKNNLDSYLKNINDEKSLKHTLSRMKQSLNVKIEELLVKKDIAMDAITSKYIIINKGLEIKDTRDKKMSDEKSRFEEEYNSILVKYEISKAQKNQSEIDINKQALVNCKAKHKETISLIKNEYKNSLQDIRTLKNNSKQNITANKEKINEIKEEHKNNVLKEKQLFNENKKALKEEFVKANSIPTESFENEVKKFNDYKNSINDKLKNINDINEFDKYQDELNSFLNEIKDFNYKETLKIISIYKSISRMIIYKKRIFISDEMFKLFKEQKNVLKQNLSTYNNEIKKNIQDISLDKKDNRYYFEIQNIRDEVSNKVIGGKI